MVCQSSINAEEGEDPGPIEFANIHITNSLETNY